LYTFFSDVTSKCIYRLILLFSFSCFFFHTRQCGHKKERELQTGRPSQGEGGVEQARQRVFPRYTLSSLVLWLVGWHGVVKIFTLKSSLFQLDKNNSEKEKIKMEEGRKGTKKKEMARAVIA
jgi:hypothetical protein